MAHPSAPVLVEPGGDRRQRPALRAPPSSSWPRRGQRLYPIVGSLERCLRIIVTHNRRYLRIGSGVRLPQDFAGGRECLTRFPGRKVGGDQG
jgi:hypothetical protein